MKFPEDLLYSEDHEWLRLTQEKTPDGRRIGIVGISDFAQSELGELVYVEVETVGETLGSHAVFGTLEAVKTTSDLFMPVGGEVLAFNPALDEKGGDNPALINSDPYGEGWIIRIAVSDESETAHLMKADTYAAKVG
ncbi:MAG TPA: glycine cleavage system protein GcvH [Saprospiraceae bacterium]|nr:glycine cleavage system protein GcvH [Saprospiraceae bacterium]